MDKLEYEGLRPYCNTELQRQMLDAYYAQGSMRLAAEALGVSKSALFGGITRIRKHAARAGYSPGEDKARLAAPGFFVKRKSTYYDLRSGEPTHQWLITEPEKELRWEALVTALAEAAERVPRMPAKLSVPRTTCQELLAVYPYGDPHIGMYAWHGDAEADFDLSTAVAMFTDVTTQLVSAAPAAEQALLVFLGDFFHSDNQQNRTMRSGHSLDVDSRWAKVLQVGVDIAVTLIRLALQKHKSVHVIVEIGNHDDHSAVMLAVCLNAFFRDEKRVCIDLSPARFHYYLFGKNLIGVHHGDLVKPAALPGVMASDRAQEWGRANHRVWYTGHIHNQKRYDYAGCEVESFRILPPRDAYSQAAGYRSGRSMDCIIRHSERGEIARHTVHVA